MKVVYEKISTDEIKYSGHVFLKYDYISDRLIISSDANY